MKTLLVAATVTLGLSLPSLAHAQDTDGPQKRENTIYYTMSLVDFKPGAEEKAWELIYDHFVPVDRTVGREIVNFDFHSGGWDHVVFFPMGESTDELEWSRSPSDVGWWNAFVEQEGGEEEAAAMMERFEGLIARSARHIVHRHMDSAQ